MRKQPLIIEWHITENEAEWARLTAVQRDHTASLTAQQLSFYKNACWALAFILGLLLTLGGCWWHNAPADVQHAMADYNLLVADLLLELARPVVLRDSSMLTGIPTGASVVQLEPAIVLVEVQDEQLVVSIVTAINAGQLNCREQRLYHQTSRVGNRSCLMRKCWQHSANRRLPPLPLALCATKTGWSIGLPRA